MPAAGAGVVSPAAVCRNGYGRVNGKCRVVLLFQLQLSCQIAASLALLLSFHPALLAHGYRLFKASCSSSLTQTHTTEPRGAGLCTTASPCRHGLLRSLLKETLPQLTGSYSLSQIPKSSSLKCLLLTQPAGLEGPSGDCNLSQVEL